MSVECRPDVGYLSIDTPVGISTDTLPVDVATECKSTHRSIYRSVMVWTTLDRYYRPTCRPILGRHVARYSVDMSPDTRPTLGRQYRSSIGRRVPLIHMILRWHIPSSPYMGVSFPLSRVISPVTLCSQGSRRWQWGIDSACKRFDSVWRWWQNWCTKQESWTWWPVEGTLQHAICLIKYHWKAHYVSWISCHLPNQLK